MKHLDATQSPLKHAPLFYPSSSKADEGGAALPKGLRFAEGARKEEIRDMRGKLWYSIIMIKNPEILDKFENQFVSSQRSLSYEQSQRLYTAMWEEGVALGALPAADPLAGIGVDIRMARILNSCSAKSLRG
jgi:hypothetical protein